MTTFKTGDAVVHPVRGAGVVERVEEREGNGSDGTYYRIRLLGQPVTKLVVPIDAAGSLGLRRAISQSGVRQLWQVLLADPSKLPRDHKTRCQMVKDKLSSGDTFDVAEAVRDMAWRRRREGHLSITGRRMYEDGLRFLAGEIAAALGVDFADAERQLRGKLLESLSSPGPM